MLCDVGVIEKALGCSQIRLPYSICFISEASSGEGSIPILYLGYNQYFYINNGSKDYLNVNGVARSYELCIKNSVPLCYMEI